jgi:hypothetical protein
MEQRIHSKKPLKLTYRHYLSHFKWPLLGFLIILIFLIFTPVNFKSLLLPAVIEEPYIELVDTNVIYPIDVLDHNDNEPIDQSIEYYFRKKDQLKIDDDAEAVENNYKTVLPLMKDRTTSESYLILEYTKVFGRPKFCSSTDEKIFGQFCPYKNW